MNNAGAVPHAPGEDELPSSKGGSGRHLKSLAELAVDLRGETVAEGRKVLLAKVAGAARAMSSRAMPCHPKSLRRDGSMADFGWRVFVDHRCSIVWWPTGSGDVGWRVDVLSRHAR